MSIRNPMLGAATRYNKCLEVVPSINRIRYMPDKKNIVTRQQAALLRTPEQNRVLNDPDLAKYIREWHYGGGLYDIRALIRHDAFIGLCAIIDAGAWIGKNVTIDGQAEVDGAVAGNAHITDHAQIGHLCHIKGNCTIGGHASIGEGVVIKDRVTIGGNMDIHGNVILGGDMHIIGDFCITKSHVKMNSIVITEEKQWKAIRAAFNAQRR